MNNNQSKTISNNSKLMSDPEFRRQKKTYDVRHSLSRIGVFSSVVFLIAAGIEIGLIGRLAYEPRMFNFKLEGFSVSLPFRPALEEIKGRPPFSNRKLLSYRAAVAPDEEYQILVMVPVESDSPEEKSPDLKLTTDNTEMEQWAQSTIAVLCFDENHSIRKDCLQKGSRLTGWNLVTGDGRRVQGSLQRARSGKIIQLLATGTTEEEALEFIESFRHE